MRQILVPLTLLLLCASALCNAQVATPRVLANIQVRDLQGQVLDADALRMPRNWVLVILDSELPSARNLLVTLTAKETVWSDNVSVLLLGESPQELLKEIAANPKLANVRLLTANDKAVLQVLELPGVPAVLGIRENQQIGWVRSGVPADARRLDSLLTGWVQRVAAPR
ncbi:MAG: hypothetical protein SXG53_14900 [Pseudomonadota bacterium]|nr:hypothetical protein [Pseudomonadota bacterium]